MAIWATPSGADPFQGLPNLSSDFYNDAGDGSREALRRYLGSLGLAPQQRALGQGMFGDLNRAYGAYSLAQPDPTSTRFTSWLTSGGGADLLEQMNQLNAQQRGYNQGAFGFGGARKMF